MSSDAMKFNTFLVWLTNEKFQRKLPRQVMLVLNGTLGQSIEQGESKMRSIGVATWYEKFTSTCVSSMTNSKIVHRFDKNYAMQPDGSAKINHVIQTGRELELHKLTTKTDARNAFLSMSRESMFTALTNYLPALGPHTKGLLEDTNVYCAGKDEGVDWISQEDGITIGGQRSTVCYCAGANELLEEKQVILNNYGGGIIRAVVDDEIFHSAEEGTNMIRTFNETEGPARNGVQQNLHKWATLLPIQYTLQQRDELRQKWNNQNVFLHPHSYDAIQMQSVDVEEYEKICREYGIVITGIPCGSDEYIQVFIDKFILDLQEEVDKFKAIDKSHAKWAILKQSISKRIVHLQRGMTPEAISKTNLIDRYKTILRDMLGDVLKVRSDSIQDHSMAIAWLRTIDGGGGLQYHEDNTLPAYVASYTAALREIVKAFPIVQDMIQTQIRGDEWDDSIQTRPQKLIQYFNSIQTLTQFGSCLDGKEEVVSLQGLWDLSEDDKTLKGLQGRLSTYTHKFRLEKIRKELSELQPYKFNHVQVLTSSSGSEAACFINTVPRGCTDQGQSTVCQCAS
jgi:hypothetical protein